MTADTHDDLLEASLTICAERQGDIVPEVFDRFFKLSESGHTLMKQSDQHMQGRMFEAVLDVLLSEATLKPGAYLDWELDNHLIAYSVTPQMYEDFLTVVVEVVKEALADGWDAAYENAWSAKVSAIMERVTTFEQNRVTQGR